MAQPGARLLSHGPQSAGHALSHRQEARASPEAVAVQIVTTQLQDTQVLEGSLVDAPRSDNAADAPQLAAAGKGIQIGAASQNVFDANELELPSDTEAACKASRSHSSMVQSVVGFVTSGVVRGVSRSTGALGLCSWAALQQAQLPSRDHDAMAADAKSIVAMQLQNPSSQVPHRMNVQIQYM